MGSAWAQRVTWHDVLIDPSMSYVSFTKLWQSLEWSRANITSKKLYIICDIPWKWCGKWNEQFFSTVAPCSGLGWSYERILSAIYLSKSFNQFRRPLGSNWKSHIEFQNDWMTQLHQPSSAPKLLSSQLRHYVVSIGILVAPDEHGKSDWICESVRSINWSKHANSCKCLHELPSANHFSDFSDAERASDLFQPSIQEAAAVHTFCSTRLQRVSLSITLAQLVPGSSISFLLRIASLRF